MLIIIFCCNETQIIITLSTVKDELPKEDYQRLQNEKVKVSLNIAKCHQALGEHKFCLDSIDNVVSYNSCITHMHTHAHTCTRSSINVNLIHFV